MASVSSGSGLLRTERGNIAMRSIGKTGGRARRGAHSLALATSRLDLFQGLPPEAHHPRLLVEWVVAAGKRSGLNPGAVILLTHLVTASDRREWGPGGFPRVSISNDRLALVVGSVATVSRQVRLLRESGAIAVDYGPSNRRHPVRDARGIEVVFHGFDLRPLVAFALRCKGIALQQKERQRALLVLAGEINRAAMDAEDLFLTAAGQAGEDGQVQQDARIAGIRALSAEARAIRRRDPRADDERQAHHLRRLNEIRDFVCDQVEEGRALLFGSMNLRSTASGNEDLIPMESTQNYVELGKTGQFQPTDTGEADFDPGAEAPRGCGQGVEGKGRFSEGGLSSLVALSSSVRRLAQEYLFKQADSLTPEDLLLVGRIAARQAGYNPRSFERAVTIHGSGLAATAALLVLDLPDHQVRSSRGAYLAGLLRKPVGQLHPLASFFRLADERKGCDERRQTVLKRNEAWPLPLKPEQTHSDCVR